MVMASLMALTSITSAFACTGTIVGSDWTDDGSTIVARTEDISGNHAENYIVHPRTTYKAGEMFKECKHRLYLSAAQRCISIHLCAGYRHSGRRLLW